MDRLRVAISLNDIVKKRPVAFWDDMTISASDNRQVVARRNLLYWYAEREGHLEPLVKSGRNYLVPDEIVIRTLRGKVLARWTIVDENNARAVSLE